MSTAAADYARATFRTMAVLADPSASPMDRYAAAEAKRPPAWGPGSRGRARARGGRVMARREHRGKHEPLVITIRTPGQKLTLGRADGAIIGGEPSRPARQPVVRQVRERARRCL